MRTYSSLIQLAALGALSAAGAAAAAVDTSAWKCETCPYPKGTSVSVEAGVGGVSEESAKFGDYTGLQRKEAHAILGGSVSHRSGSGYYADLAASDLGLDTRSLGVSAGLEGLYALRLGYAELPRHLIGGAQTPFAGSGSGTLTLPAGFAAGSTATMPLATTLQPVDIGYKRQRYDLAGKLMLGDNWTWRVTLRRDVRDGSQATAGSGFANAAQLVAPLDQTTDQLEVSASYVARGLHATLSYQLSEFQNGAQSLTWDNPFLPVVPGATRGQLALAPDNRLQQVTAAGGYEISPILKVSGEISAGSLTQDSAYLLPTLNASLAPSVPALAAQSLDGEVDTFNGSLRLSAAPIEGLRLTASYARDVRNNRTAIRSYPVIAADIFLIPQPRSNTPFDFAQDRYKLQADYRGPATWKFAGGAEQDNRKRSYTEAVDTRETTLWGRVSVQPRDDLALALKLAHAEREHSGYGTAVWFGTAENPLLRKFNLAERRRDSVGLRADFNASETLTLGLTMDYADDAYGESLIGLRSARSFSGAVDMALALNERTQLTAFAQSENIRSRQRGSESFAAPDWAARHEDQFDVLGIGVKHAAIVGKLDIGAELSVSRSRSEIAVDTAVGEAQFPLAKTSLDSLKLHASYKLQDNLWLNASWWYESYEARDWRLDGVAPATVQNLLSFGQQAPQYNVNVVRVSLRYRF